MSKILVTIKRNDAAGTVKSLEGTDILSKTRSALALGNLMTPEDAFLFRGNPIIDSDEEEIKLEDILDTDNELSIGGASIGPTDPDQSIATWANLSDSQRTTLFDTIEIRRGLIAGESQGFSKSFKNAVDWKNEDLNSNTPRVVTEVSSEYTFSEVLQDLETFGIQKASVSFTSPFASGEAEYEHEQTHSESSQLTKTYFIGKYIDRKVAISVEANKMKATQEFIDAISAAVKDHQDSVDGYQNLINELDKFGYYVASQFTLGGLLYSQEETEISEFKEADSEKESFSASFKATFDGIGGGAAYSNASGSSTSSSNTDKFENMTLQQIGGINGTQNDYNKWIEGLDPASNWNVASFEKLVPTIALIGMHNQGMGNVCTKLLSKYYSYGSVKQLQTMIDMGNYATESESYFLNPF